ncbi:hypothetical protein KAR91_14295 [Candidatus Pacearchaeota archaeon]|nr:hypothetical protein [Candidatus Pacearchaeota archaeon]
MKYKAKQIQCRENKGKWAVFFGRKFFTSSVTDSKKVAEKEACLESLRWHRDQMDKIKLELIDFYGMDDRDIGDLLA